MDVPATTRSSKRRSMDGAVPSTPPSSGKTKRREGQGGGYGGVSAGVLDFGVRDEKTKAPGETSPIVKRSSEDSMGDPQTLSTSSPSLSGESGEDDDMHTDGGVDAVAREAAEVRGNVRPIPLVAPREIVTSRKCRGSFPSFCGFCFFGFSQF